MILSIIIIIAIALVAYFHYAQGFFSATVSAIIATLAAVLSVSYSETFVNAVLRGKMADAAEPFTLCVMFGAIYLVLRIIFDLAVPGNLRFPAIVDVIGGGIMGIIAGVMATGVLALAVQAMGFGPSIGGFGVFPVRGGDRNVIIQGSTPGGGAHQVDAVVSNEVDVDTLDPAKQKTLVVPVDDILLGLVQHLSDDGSLSGDRTLDSVHPNWPLELFGQRSGVQVGAKRTALDFAPAFEWVKVAGAYSVPSLPEVDGELKDVRGVWVVPAVQRPHNDQTLLVVRVTVSHEAGDETDGLFRFSTGSVRLVANKKDYFPLGTVYGGATLLAQKPDDPLFLDLSGASEGAIDFAFMVDSSDVLGPGARGGASKFAAGAFIEVKRYGRVDLSGIVVKPSLPTPTEAGPILKTTLLAQAKVNAVALGTASPAGGTASAPQANRPSMPVVPAPQATPAIVATTARSSAELPHAVGVSTTDVNAQNVAVAGGSVSLTDSRMAVVKIDGSAALDKLGAGDNQLTELYVPDGKKLVQISTASSPPSDWASNGSSLQLIDAGGHPFSCNGMYAVVTTGSNQGFFVQYDASHPAPAAAAPTGTVGMVTYLFVVPAGTTLKQSAGAGAPVPLSLTVQ